MAGFVESAGSNSVGTLLVDWVAKPAKSQLDYVRHFHENVQKLEEKRKEVLEARDRLQHEIEETERQLQLIEAGVRSCQSKAEEILTQAESMEKRIAENKRCFNWCPNWWWRYRLSKKLEKKTLPEIDQILDKIAKFGQSGKVGYRDASTVPTIEFLSSKDFWASKSSKAAADQMIEALKDEKVSRIALRGMGGVGKTTLVREVGIQAKKLDLFDKVVTATVSKNPNFETIQDEIAKYLDFSMDDRGKRRSKQEFCLRLQKEKRILIILDDVWSKIKLKEDIGIPESDQDHKGCKILFTTRRHQVVQLMDCQKEVELGCLDVEDAWELFQMKAGLRNCNDDAIKKVAAEVIKKCQGLPVSIIALGAALKGKSLAQWEATCRRLKSRRLMDIEDIDDDENTYLCLEQSFDYLKDMPTKKCLLLCSLFPEDYKINVEELVRYARGLEIFKGIHSIEEVRIEVFAAVDNLKDSCLLLDCGKSRVKMHDTVRDVALWISSNRKDLDFVIKPGAVETWPKDESLESCTAIYYKTSPIANLPEGLVCPNLKILLLGRNNYFDPTRTPSAFLEGMRALQVCFLYNNSISQDAFQFPINLRTLHFESCRFPKDISVLGNLTELQILSISDEFDNIRKLPGEFGNLINLQLLDLSKCKALQRIPPGLMQRLSQLEELYLHGCKSLEWATENDQEERCASLSELNILSKLTVLTLDVAPKYLPQDFKFQKLQRFDVWIDIETRWDYNINFPVSRCLRTTASGLYACQQLFEDMESLHLKSLVGCSESLVGSLGFEPEVFNKLNSLGLKSCGGMKCLIDTTTMQSQTIAFSKLEMLSVSNMPGLEEFCHGPQPQGFLQNLERVNLISCNELQVIFQPDQEEAMLPELGRMEHGGPNHHNLRSLKVVSISYCKKLKYLFPASVATSLGQLEELNIDSCLELEEIIQETEVSNISFKSLRKVIVRRCNSLTSLSSLSHGQVLESLSELHVIDCDRLEYTFPLSMAQGLPQRKGWIWKRRCADTAIFTAIGYPIDDPFYHFIKTTGMTSTRKQLSNTVMIPELRPNRECLTITPIEELFDSSYNLSALKKLQLDEVSELRVIWKGPIKVENFQNLTRLNVVSCQGLKYIFSPTIARNLPQLSDLYITDCEGLEQIIEKDVEPSSQDHYLQPICFPNLTHILIWRCANLKSLFSVSVARRGLPKLKRLVVYDMSELEQVFERGDVSMADGDEVLIQLPQLEEVRLRHLPSLVRFSPVGCHFAFPSLRRLFVKDCPNITTRFSVDSKQCVHAITEDEDGMEGQYATAQVKTWAIGGHIRWRWHY